MPKKETQVVTPCGCVGHHEYPSWSKGIFMVLVIDEACERHREAMP